MQKLKILAMSILVSTVAFSASYVLAVDQVQDLEKAQNQIQGSQSAMQQNKLSTERGMGKDQAQVKGIGSSGRSMDQNKGKAGENIMPAFADFDLNNDGKITEKEFIQARTARISERAQEGRQMKGLTNIRSFAEIDTNNDGVITLEEFAAQQSAHRQLN